MADVQAQIASIRQRQRDRLEFERATFLADGGDCFACRDEGPCAECDRGRLVAQQIHDRYVRLRREELLTGAQIPPRCRDWSLATYPSKSTAGGYAVVLDFLAGWDGQRGLILRGKYGTGKSGLLVGLLREIAGMWADTDHRMRFVTSTDLMDELRASIAAERNTPHATESYTAQLDRFRWRRLLAIDDLGAEKPTEWVQERLFSIINHRYEHQLPTFATTNYGLTELAERIGPRVLERLIETSEVIAVEGPNLRRRGHQREIS